PSVAPRASIGTRLPRVRHPLRRPLSLLVGSGQEPPPSRRYVRSDTVEFSRDTTVSSVPPTARAWPASLRASVGSTEASASLPTRFGVVGPKHLRAILVLSTREDSQRLDPRRRGRGLHSE